jgi:hypothetical protein
MTEQELIEGNTVLIEFDDFVFVNDDPETFPNGYYFHPDMGYYEIIDTSYHISWDWLMPIIEKIEAIRNEKYGWFGVYINSNSCSIQSKYAYKAMVGTPLEIGQECYLSDPNAVFPTKIESVWYNMVQFLKWYKQQK